PGEAAQQSRGPLFITGDKEDSRALPGELESGDLSNAGGRARHDNRLALHRSGLRSRADRSLRPRGGPASVRPATGRTVTDIGTTGDIDGRSEGAARALGRSGFDEAVNAALAPPGFSFAAFKSRDLRPVRGDPIAILQSKPDRAAENAAQHRRIDIFG